MHKNCFQEKYQYIVVQCANITNAEVIWGLYGPWHWNLFDVDLEDVLVQHSTAVCSFYSPLAVSIFVFTVLLVRSFSDFDLSIEAFGVHVISCDL